MPHADLVVASGRDGKSVVRIQTYSPNHLVVVHMNFRNCAHGNLMPDRDPTVGVGQLRILHYSRVDIAKFCEYYRSRPYLSMIGGMHAAARCSTTQSDLFPAF
eukprot:5509574-Pleurochrysis_carterae.AAC.1